MTTEALIRPEVENSSSNSRTLSPTAATINESLLGVLDDSKICPVGTYTCGSLCCRYPETCSVDITASFHCCADKTFCAANTTNTPVSAANRSFSQPVLYWFVIAFSLALAVSGIHDTFDDGSISSTSPTLRIAQTSPLSTKIVELDTGNDEAPRSEQRDECAGVLWKELRKCCVGGTIPHYYTNGERGCCDRALDGQSNAQIEAQCPVAVGQSNLRPLGDGVVRSQATRFSPEWARYVLKKLSGTGLWKREKRVTATTTNKEVTATKRQIVGPGCGGFDPDCTQTCPPGFASCQTSAAQAVSSSSKSFAFGIVLVLGLIFAFLR